MIFKLAKSQHAANTPVNQEATLVHLLSLQFLSARELIWPIYYIFLMM